MLVHLDGDVPLLDRDDRADAERAAVGEEDLDDRLATECVHIVLEPLPEIFGVEHVVSLNDHLANYTERRQKKPRQCAVALCLDLRPYRSR